MAKLDSFRPIETTLDFPLKQDPLVLTEREVYRDYISKVFPALAKIIGTKWTAELSSSRGAPAYGNTLDVGASGTPEGFTGTMNPRLW